MLSPDQVQQLRAKYLAPKEKAPAPSSSLMSVAKGFVKGAAESVVGAARLGEDVARTVTKPLIGVAADKTAPELQIDTNIDASLESKNTAESVGKAVEFLAEILSPVAVAKSPIIAKEISSHLPSLIKKFTGREALIAGTKPGASIEEVASAADRAKSLVSKSHAVMAGKETPGALAQEAKAGAAQVSFTEKLAGLAPDIKARIKGKGPLLADYLNIADARNASDLVPTPLEYGAHFADAAKTKMETLINESGSIIGKTRAKLATYKPVAGAFDGIRNEFTGQLSKLNLMIKDGKVVKMPGKIAQTVSDSEISSLQSLYDDLGTASQSPTLENIIDLRTKFDNKINFEKASRDVSGSLDQLSRAVRKKAADVAAGIVGKSQAAELESYSKFMDAYNDLRSYTDRKAGAEFLLKRVFSERGGDPRAVMQTIKEFTGIDLMDHAMMAKISTELAGNPQMQGLFRQEITKAGLDAANLLKGNPAGAIDTLFQKAMDQLVDRRKIFEAAAQ